MKPIKIMLALCVAFISCLCVFVAVDASHPLIASGIASAVLGAVSLFVLPQNALYVSLCGAMDASIGYDCNTPVVGGIDDTLYLIDHEDFASATLDGSNPLLISDLILNSGAVALTITGTKKSNNHTAKMVAKKYTNMFEHSFDFVVFKNDPATKKSLMLATNRRYIVIHENFSKGTSGNSAFEVSGYDSGLIVSVMDRDARGTDTNGAWTLQLKSDPDNLESLPPRTFFDTDYPTTKAKVVALA